MTKRTYGRIIIRGDLVTMREHKLMRAVPQAGHERLIHQDIKMVIQS
jgi:hypothetical protein